MKVAGKLKAFNQTGRRKIMEVNSVLFEIIGISCFFFCFESRPISKISSRFQPKCSNSVPAKYCFVLLLKKKILQFYDINFISQSDRWIRLKFYEESHNLFLYLMLKFQDNQSLKRSCKNIDDEIFMILFKFIIWFKNIILLYSVFRLSFFQLHHSTIDLLRIEFHNLFLFVFFSTIMVL